MLLNILVALFALPFVLGLEEPAEAKAETGCVPCNSNNASKQVCPADIALQAGALLVEDLCDCFEVNNLAEYQSLIHERSTMRYVMMTPSGCFDSGVGSFMTILIPFMTIAVCPGEPEIISSYIDERNRLIIFATEYYIIDGTIREFKNRYTFEALQGGCRYSVSDLLIRQVDCI